jgi:hypothetical protein
MMKLKTCSSCKQTKDIAEWYPSSLAKSSYCKKCSNEKAVKTRKRNRTQAVIDRERAGWLKRVYDITVDEYEAMLNKQGGMCAICGASEGARRLHVDHDHNTGKLRGILCGNCNRGLGQFNDSPEKLMLAYSYLKDNS